ncbi:hypothetical protein GM418_26180 [Maribellus comscasis]|uniref:Uncharacterized protein n=1 Tax=Maribellus comscasis TaxID=2681766 RepID=A0A6I6K5V6_9BACT|nr:hypothetical protein [Maribellus comscasis]QGY47023.1 hypothetical protein GM418_26180 [Maribellus comscasis]
MKSELFTFVYLALFVFFANGQSYPQEFTGDVWNYAVSRKNDLRLGVYLTAHTVENMFSTEEGKRETISLLRCNGISKVYLEVYRSGLVVSPDLLSESVIFLQKNGFEVVGGIATVPGGDFGVKQDGTLGWFNWQNKKTQNDLRKVIKSVVPVFDTFIIDDFLCTADTSRESKIAKGDKSWSEYRRELLTDLSESVFIKPAWEANPDIKMIIKFPQWYDRFHIFGYDLAKEPALFDGVWAGTETRGQYTQRFGFVQPYEGFINYRWISTFAGEKMGGAWFDHGDCSDLDFIEQAWQSVLAGAKELVIFNFGSFISGHPGHHLLRRDFEKLADLAAAVAKNPIQGAVAYKPANSDAGGDLYLMDYMGMLGISLVPESEYPENADVVFLPTQAASDENVVKKAINSLQNGTKLVVTTGFLAHAKDGEKLAKIAQISCPLTNQKITTDLILNNGKEEQLPFSMTLDYKIIPDGATSLLAVSNAENPVFMVQNKKQNISVINTYTFSQEDFNRVGEVLLCPRQIGLLEVPQNWANTVRDVFRQKSTPELNAPTRVTFQNLSDGSFVLHNYNRGKAIVEIHVEMGSHFVDGFSGEELQMENQVLKFEMAPRSRIWCKKKN